MRDGQGAPAQSSRELGAPEERDKLVGYFTGVIPQLADAGIPNLICLSGNARGLSKEQGLKNCARGLKRIMALGEKRGVTICLELLNSKVSHKDYLAGSTAFGVEPVRRVGDAAEETGDYLPIDAGAENAAGLGEIVRRRILTVREPLLQLGLADDQHAGIRAGRNVGRVVGLVLVDRHGGYDVGKVRLA